MSLRLFCPMSQLLPPTKLAQGTMPWSERSCNLWSILILMCSGSLKGKGGGCSFKQYLLWISNHQVKLYAFIIYNRTQKHIALSEIISTFQDCNALIIAIFYVSSLPLILSISYNFVHLTNITSTPFSITQPSCTHVK